MGAEMVSPASPEEWCVLPWDSDFFGVRIGRVDAESVADDDISRLRTWAEREAVECVYYLADADDTPSIHAAERGGFSLMDIRVTLERVLAPDELGGSGTADGIDVAAAGDIDGLAAIARTSHRDSRFYADPHFPEQRCDDFYEQWIRNSCDDFADVVINHILRVITTTRNGPPIELANEHQQLVSSGIDTGCEINDSTYLWLELGATNVCFRPKTSRSNARIGFIAYGCY